MLKWQILLKAASWLVLKRVWRMRNIEMIVVVMVGWAAGEWRHWKAWMTHHWNLWECEAIHVLIAIVRVRERSIVAER